MRRKVAYFLKFVPECSSTHRWALRCTVIVQRVLSLWYWSTGYEVHVVLYDDRLFRLKYQDISVFRLSGSSLMMAHYSPRLWVLFFTFVVCFSSFSLLYKPLPVSFVQNDVLILQKDGQLSCFGAVGFWIYSALFLEIITLVEETSFNNMADCCSDFVLREGWKRLQFFW